MVVLRLRAGTILLMATHWPIAFFGSSGGIAYRGGLRPKEAKVLNQSLGVGLDHFVEAPTSHDCTMRHRQNVALLPHNTTVALLQHVARYGTVP